MKTVKALLAAGVVLAALCGCTPTRYVPVETVRTSSQIGSKRYGGNANHNN